MSHLYSWSDRPLNDTAGGSRGQLCVGVVYDDRWWETGAVFFSGGGKLLELFSHSDDDNLQWWGHYQADAPPAHAHVYFPTDVHMLCWGRMGGKNDGELTKETSDHPPLSLHRRWEAHQRPLLAGGVSPPGHLLPRLRSIALIVLLFIYFTIDFSVGADVALINSDWPVMVWWMEQSQWANTMQDKCDTLLCVCAVCASRCVFVCTRIFYGFTTPPCHVCMFLCAGVCVCVCARDEHVVPAGGKKKKKMARSRTMCHNYAQGVTARNSVEAIWGGVYRYEHTNRTPYWCQTPPPLTTFSPHPLWPVAPLSATSCVY